MLSESFITLLQDTMEISFLVKGSAADPYIVEFIKRSEGNVSAYCSCAAGQNGMYCKHRFRIIKGDCAGIISDNSADVKTVQGWMPGTDIEKTLMQVELLEAEMDKLKKLLSSAKKDVAKAMRD